eukprot:TRINITY_DN3958_c0_g1_i1.p1 TRINITY_DN3958_c0_g1~~TRINITY_DN3958_c0_g1_i1.p1  ORF type:complete len:196 (+),score=31.72 TRINITY_DN3958_c0_g1_i1:143-730(+)
MSKKENLTPKCIKRIAKELKDLTTKPPEGMKVTLSDNDITVIQATLEGPVGTPYEGGAFKIKLKLTSEFPVAPPKGFFLTKIFHPNVSKSGEICVNTLKKDWKEDLGIKHVLITIRCLLIYPNPESSLNEEAGRLLLEDYAEYAKRARVHTAIHGKPAPVATTSRSSSTVSGKTATKRKVSRAKGNKKKKSLKRL